MKLDDPEFKSPSQVILGPNLAPTRNLVLSNQTPGLRCNLLLRTLLTFSQGIIYALQRLLESSSSSAYSVLCHPGVSHFRAEFKTFGWGCGYHNAQMLLSSLREISPDEYRKAFGGDIPTIRTLQTLIQAGWAKGNKIFQINLLTWRRNR